MNTKRIKNDTVRKVVFLSSRCATYSDLIDTLHDMYGLSMQSIRSLDRLLYSVWDSVQTAKNN